MTPDENRSARDAARLARALAIVAAVAFLVSFFPIEDSDDDWWHLKAGKLLWDGELGWYSNDPFTFSARDKLWVNHEWLAQWLFYGCYALGGLAAANLFKALVVAATFLVVYSSGFRVTFAEESRRDRAVAALLATLLAIPTAQFTMYLRPPVWSFLFLAVYQSLLLNQPKADGKRIALLAMLMVLWANLHGGAILGCVLLVFVAVGQGWSRWIPAAGVVLGASLLNPYGWHLHALTFEVMSHPWVTSRISELEPPRLDLVWTVPLLLLPAAVGVVRHGGWGERLMFLFLLWQGLSHVRHLPLLAIWAAPYAAVVLVNSVRELSRGTLAASALAGFGLMVFLCLPEWFPLGLLEPKTLWAMLGIGTLATLALLVVGTRLSVSLFLWASVIAIAFVIAVPGQRPVRFVNAAMGQTWVGRNFPDRLADFILEHKLTSPILLSREGGAGMLIWKLSPETMRVFTCSRFDLQGGIPIKELDNLLWMREEPWTDPDTGARIAAWRELWNEKYHFDLAILPKYADPQEAGMPFPLWEYLNGSSSGFVQVAAEAWPGLGPSDRQFTLFVRKGDPLTRLMAKIGSPRWFD